MKAVYILLDFYLEFSLNTCLQRTNVKKAMETRNEQFGQDGREHGWCSSKYPQGVAKAYLQCLFFFAYVFQKYDPFQSSEETLTTCRAAESSWVKKESDAMLSNTKQMDEKTTHSKLQLTFLNLRNWNLHVAATIQTAQTLSSTSTWPEHQNQTSKLKPSHVFTYYSLDSLDLFDLGLFWNQCLVSLWTARLTFWPRVYRVFVKFLLVTVLCAVLNLR